MVVQTLFFSLIPWAMAPEIFPARTAPVASKFKPFYFLPFLLHSFPNAVTLNTLNGACNAAKEQRRLQKKVGRSYDLLKRTFHRGCTGACNRGCGEVSHPQQFPCQEIGTSMVLVSVLLLIKCELCLLCRQIGAVHPSRNFSPSGCSRRHAERQPLAASQKLPTSQSAESDAIIPLTLYFGTPQGERQTLPLGHERYDCTTRYKSL